jgi:hypothetical protein
MIMMMMMMMMMTAMTAMTSLLQRHYAELGQSALHVLASTGTIHHVLA